MGNISDFVMKESDIPVDGLRKKFRDFLKSHFLKDDWFAWVAAPPRVVAPPRVAAPREIRGAPRESRSLRESRALWAKVPTRVAAPTSQGAYDSRSATGQNIISLSQNVISLGFFLYWTELSRTVW